MRTTLATFTALILALAACSAEAEPEGSEPTETQAVKMEPSASPTFEIPAYEPEIDNAGACLEFQSGDDPLADRIPEAIAASRSNAPGATTLMLNVHTDIRFLLMETDGPLAEALTQLGEPFQTFNDAYYAGENEVDMDVVAVPYDLQEVLEICDRL